MNVYTLHCVKIFSAVFLVYTLVLHTWSHGLCASGINCMYRVVKKLCNKHNIVTAVLTKKILVSLVSQQVWKAKWQMQKETWKSIKAWWEGMNINVRILCWPLVLSLIFFLFCSLFIFALLCYLGLCEDVFNSDLEFSESETTSACKYPSTVCFLGMKCDAYI